MTVPGEVTFKVKQFIAARERFTTGQVAKVTGLNRKSVETVVQRLVRDGYVVKSRETAPGTGRGRRPLYYTLTADMKKRKELVDEVSAFQPGAVPVRIHPLSANYLGAHDMLDELEREPDAPDREAQLAKIEKHLELAAFEEGLEDGEEGTAVVWAYLLRERARVAALRHQWDFAKRLLDEARLIFEKHGLEEEVEKTDQYRFTLLIRQRLAVARDVEEIARVWQEIPRIVQEMGLAANPVGQLAVEMSRGLSILPLSRAQLEKDWQAAQELFEAGECFETTVSGYNKGGLIVRLGKVRGFVPASQLAPLYQKPQEESQSSEEYWARMVGQQLRLKIIELDRRRNRLILSERAATREWRRQQKDKLLNELQEGDIRRGRVSSFFSSYGAFVDWGRADDLVHLNEFQEGDVCRGRVSSLFSEGAFIDLGGADGWIHFSELPCERASHPNEVLQVGDEVDVHILSVDRDERRIDLSLKRLQPEPWSLVPEKYSVGQLVQGTITKLTNFAAFARLENDEIEGLIHISELSEDPIAHPKEVVKEGDVVTLRIIRIDAKRRHTGLSLKRVRERK
jgi:small subunit ribosomal protein S1